MHSIMIMIMIIIIIIIIVRGSGGGVDSVSLPHETKQKINVNELIKNTKQQVKKTEKFQTFVNAVRLLPSVYVEKEWLNN